MLRLSHIIINYPCKERRMLPQNVAIIKTSADVINIQLSVKSVRKIRFYGTLNLEDVREDILLDNL